MMFDYVVPGTIEAAAKKKKKAEGGKKKKPGDGPVRTQMVPENPADGLGYDPATVPTEKI
ncbi:MAG: hypothetical protein HYS27_23925 [Deltaproteobacteria bacterium]|nr:hypothetical protein [Deltaproteobacteria bacterium]